VGDVVIREKLNNEYIFIYNEGLKFLANIIENKDSVKLFN